MTEKQLWKALGVMTQRRTVIVERTIYIRLPAYKIRVRQASEVGTLLVDVFNVNSNDRDHVWKIVNEILNNKKIMGTFFGMVLTHTPDCTRQYYSEFAQP